MQFAGVCLLEIAGKSWYLFLIDAGHFALETQVVTVAEIIKGDEITIHGSGFGELPAWNVVAVNNERVWIAGGDNHNLRVQLRRMDNSPGLASCQKCSIVVLTRGGRKAVAPQALELLGDPYVIRIVGPDDQIATVSGVRGSVLPVEVRVLDSFK